MSQVAALSNPMAIVSRLIVADLHRADKRPSVWIPSPALLIPVLLFSSVVRRSETLVHGPEVCDPIRSGWSESQRYHS